MPYDRTLVATVPLQQVRLHLGGETSDDLVEDEEITFYLAEEGQNTYYAAAAVAEMLAGQNTHRAYQHSVGPLPYDGHTKRDAWFELAKELRRKGAKNTSITGVLVGVTNTETGLQENQNSETEYPPFTFRRGMHDHEEGLSEENTVQ